VAERIATGDLTVEVALHSERDVLGVAYRRMVSNLRQLADSAERVARGELTVEIRPASENDQLGRAFSGMVSNLK
jgi:methyl-accepting chemotaxis protein